jgi:hypothetical protein
VLLGTEELMGSTCARIGSTGVQGHSVIVWIDTASGLVRRLDEVKEFDVRALELQYRQVRDATRKCVPTIQGEQVWRRLYLHMAGSPRRSFERKARPSGIQCLSGRG